MFAVRLSKIFSVFVLLLHSFNLSGETLPSTVIKNCKIDNAYTINSLRDIMEKTWQNVCRVLGLSPTDIPGGEFCVNDHGNPVYIQGGDLCADSSFKIPINFGWCDEGLASCPNPSWSLSQDKKTCFRSDDACWKDIENVNQLKLLAAISYGESHWSNVYEEMAGIASVAIRRRDTAGFNSINELVKKNRTFSYAVYDGNERFIKLMCGDEKNFKTAYDAYENTYISTAIRGKTIFWKLDDQFLKANGALQCR